MICPNRSCQYLRRYGARAEWPRGTRSCPACGVRLENDPVEVKGEPESVHLVAIAEFGEPHEAHLAKGRLEAEGVPACIAGEHLASMNATFADTGGLIRIEVAPEEAERALAILGRDHSDMFVDEGSEAAMRPPATTRAPATTSVCPCCGSASVFEEERAGGAFLGALLRALSGRSSRCFTCGQRWKKRTRRD